jgi:hypothetical protein
MSFLTETCAIHLPLSLSFTQAVNLTIGNTYAHARRSR